jgi:hypothetical protein
MCFAFTESVCLVFVRHALLLCVLLGWLHVGVKIIGGPHRILYAYILVDVIKAPVLEFCFGCFKIKVLCVLLVGDMWV